MQTLEKILSLVDRHIDQITEISGTKTADGKMRGLTETDSKIIERYFKMLRASGDPDSDLGAMTDDELMAIISEEKTEHDQDSISD